MNIKKINIKIRLYKLGVSIKDKYFLLKYSISFHLRKFGIKSLWTGNEIEVNIKFNKKKYKIFTKDDLGFSSVFREIFIEQQYRPIIKLNNVSLVVDLGANIGLFAVYCNSYFPNAKFICVEPQGENYKYLSKNINENKLNAIKFNKAIVGNSKKKFLKIYNSISSTGFSSIQRFTDSSEFFIVEAISIQDIFKYTNIQKIDILKCDIEGSEKELFQNMPSEIKKKIRMIIVEYHSKEIFDIIINSLKYNFNLIYKENFRKVDIGLLTFINKSEII